ncbi:hypothetical protein [Sphingomonas sp. Leaf257]|jgi:hypothetical protein|uniref:hypothetical protein n=1 Tax=Sphingomonas sp. Leaf257 TaxID=1736309 RepID=UPI0006F934AE|nr:hypothetical protein [Sphingomonas sp. Leaf257]KQO56455.1 hypothetical protein ASF14_18180 [Sphingomonas sp. Leaf257]
MNINLISRGCGQGKTQAALNIMAKTEERYVMAQPSLRLVNQSHADLLGKNPDARAQVITSDTNGGVGQSIRAALSRPGLLAQSPNLLFVTHKGVMDLDGADRSGWNLIVDEIPSATEHLEYKLKLTRRYVVRHLAIRPGIGDSYELVIKPGHIEKVQAMLRDAGKDTLAAALADLWNLLLNPHYRVFVTKSEWLSAGETARGDVELNAHAILQPSVFAGWKSVTLMGANADKSRLVQIWSQMGVTFSAHPSIENMAHSQATGMRLTVRYMTNKVWTRYLRDNALGRTGFRDMVSKLVPNLPDDYIWSANNADTGKVEQIMVGRKLPPVSHGLNAYRSIDTAVSLGSFNDDLAHARFLSDAFQLSDEDLFRSRAGEMTYQMVMRTSLRMEGESKPVSAFVPDWRTAEFLAELLPGARVEHLDLGIEELRGAKPRFRVANTAAERMAKTRSKQAAAVERSNELLELHRIASGALVGEAPVIITSKAVVATRDIASHALPDWDSLRDLLESDRHRKLDKDKAGLIVGSLMDPDASPDSVAGLANVVYTQFAWMDVDDGDCSPEQASRLLGDVKHLVYSSFNNGKVAGKHRFRIVVPMNKPVDAPTYRAIWQVLADRFAAAGFWVPTKAGEEVPGNRPVSGLDYSKCKVSDFMYRPVRTADKTKNVWIDCWSLPIMDVDGFVHAIRDDEDELLDLWLEERNAKRAREEALFKDVPDLLIQYRAQAAAATKRDAAERVAQEFAAIPSGGMNQNLFRLAKWLVASGHSPDEMFAELSMLLASRPGGKDHQRDLQDIREDAVRGRMRIAR